MKIKTIFCCGVLFLFCIASSAADDIKSGHVIAEQTLRYAAFYGRINAGAFEINIRHHDDGYLITSTAKPSALASMFVKAHVTETRFVRDGARIILDRGTERLVGESEHAHSFRIDRAHGRVEFAGGKHTEILPHEQFEAAAFPLLLMLRPHVSIDGARVREVSAKRLRDYVYDAPLADTARVPAGEFAAWKITRRRADNANSSVSVWLSRNGNPIPVKIVVQKRGKTSTLQLTQRRAG